MAQFAQQHFAADEPDHGEPAVAVHEEADHDYGGQARDAAYQQQWTERRRGETAE